MRRKRAAPPNRGARLRLMSNGGVDEADKKMEGIIWLSGDLGEKMKAYEGKIGCQWLVVVDGRARLVSSRRDALLTACVLNTR